MTSWEPGNGYCYGRKKLNHSTSLASIDLHEKISLALDRNEHAVGAFLDLSKAFDTFDHNILLDKLEHYGIRGVALDWVRIKLPLQQVAIRSI